MNKQTIASRIDAQISEEMNTDGRDRDYVIKALEELKTNVLNAESIDEAFIDKAEERLYEWIAVDVPCGPDTYTDTAYVSTVMDAVFG